MIVQKQAKTDLKHVAIIMDGNGRWAKNRFRPRVWGHVRGSHIVSKIVEAAEDYGLEALTLYAFSTENWSRPEKEISTLFNLLKKFIIKERSRILKNGIRFKVVGDTSGLPEATVRLIRDLEETTAYSKGLRLNFAFGYGGRSEIVQAVNSFIRMNPGKTITEEDLSSNLFLSEVGDVDLLIRTGGDQRISNFLLWQLAYAELYFTKTKWPEFSQEEFVKILLDVENRERRFGMISKCHSLSESKDQALHNKDFFTHEIRH